MLHVKPEAFRAALGGLPSGVTVVTSVARSGEFVGATVSAFMSLSLDPPLVLVSLSGGARTAHAVRDSAAFAVHVVGDRHQEIAMRFAAGNGVNKFDEISHRVNKRGVPVLDGFDICIECYLYAAYPGGDHVIYLGLVEDISLAELGPPAVWYDREFHRLERRSQ